MRTFSTALTLSLLSILVASLPASARSPLGMSVRADPTIPNGIAVFQLAGRGGPDYWCTAGDYAHRRLGIRSGILTVERTLRAPGGPSNRNSVGFSVSTQGAPNAGVSMTVDTVGEARTISSARAICNSRIQRLDRRGRR